MQSIMLRLSQDADQTQPDNNPTLDRTKCPNQYQMS